MKSNVFIAGFPEAGKTTFLASLFHLLDANRNQRKGFYVERPSNTTYIDSVTTQWVSVQELDRTRMNELHSLTFKICMDNTAALNLTVPDISGEIFKEILSDRRIGKEIAEKISNADTILIFIHPNRITNTRRLDTIISQAKALADLEGEQKIEEVISENFEYRNAPTQVHLVDLIQTFQKLQEPARIAIIISAWDLLKDAYNCPEDYIKKNLPLLSQFLINHKINNLFGLSANGGTIANDIERSKLEDMDPADRVSFYISDETHKGYQRLVEWLINGK